MFVKERGIYLFFFFNCREINLILKRFHYKKRLFSVHQKLVISGKVVFMILIIEIKNICLEYF